MRYKNGWTPLTLAVVCGQTKIANLLLQYGAKQNDVNNSDGTLLLVAAGGYPLPQPDALFSALVNTMTSGKQPALNSNASCIAAAALLDLVAHGENPLQLRDTPMQTTLLHVAAHRGNLPLVQLLVTHGANVNALDQEGRPATANCPGAVKDYLTARSDSQVFALRSSQVAGIGITRDGKSLVTLIENMVFSFDKNRAGESPGNNRNITLIVRDLRSWKVALQINLPTALEYYHGKGEPPVSDTKISPYYINGGPTPALTSDSRYLVCKDSHSRTLSLLDLHTGAVKPVTGVYPPEIIFPLPGGRYWAVSESQQHPGQAANLALAVQDFNAPKALREISPTYGHLLAFSQDGARAVSVEQPAAYSLNTYRQGELTGCCIEGARTRQTACTGSHTDHQPG